MSNIDNDNDNDMTIEDTKNNETELSQLKEETKRINKKKNKEKEKKEEISEEEMKRIISNYDPPAILDWPKIPYKTIFIIFLLLFSSILFLYTGITKYKANEKWTVWFSYILLGSLLIIPGGFYTFYLINILLHREGWNYEDLPDLSEQ